MFSMIRQAAKLCAFKTRPGGNGDDKQFAVDMFFEAKLPNEVLSEFDPQLKTALYTKADQEDVEPNHLPVQKFPHMSAFKWAKDFVGYEATIHHGATEKDNIVVSDVQLDRIKFHCHDGGTVLMKFRLVASPTERDSGRIGAMIQQDVEMSLTPPEGAQ